MGISRSRELAVRRRREENYSDIGTRSGRGESLAFVEEESCAYPIRGPTDAIILEKCMPSVCANRSGGPPSKPQNYPPGDSLDRTAHMQGGTRLDGYLTKKGGVQWKRRWFILEDHVITYFSKQGDLRPRGRMVLIAESRVTNLPTRVHAFQVITNAKALMVYADTKDEREHWVAALNQQITGLRERALQRRSRRNVR